MLAVKQDISKILAVNSNSSSYSCTFRMERNLHFMSNLLVKGVQMQFCSNSAVWLYITCTYFVCTCTEFTQKKRIIENGASPFALGNEQYE